MPEPYWPKHKHEFRLSDALRNGLLAQIRCRYCKVQRYYLIEDLQRLFGDIEVDDVVHDRRWRCSNCKNPDTLQIDMVSPSASELQNCMVRRIDRIEYRMRVIWKDGSL